MSEETEPVVRRSPWSHVPHELRYVVRTSPTYFRLVVLLRKDAPNEIPFTLRQVSKKLDVSLMYTRYIVNRYRLDSKIFLRYCPIPKKHETPEEQWNYAIDRLHRDGFFLVNPLKYHSRWWGEPTFRQFEDYNAQYFGEAIHRAEYRLRDAIDWSLKIDGIDVRKVLEETLAKKALLEGYEEEEKKTQS